jgi:hypothetical protein
MVARTSTAKVGMSIRTQASDIVTLTRLRFEICTNAKHVHILVAVQQKMH